MESSVYRITLETAPEVVLLDWGEQSDFVLPEWNQQTRELNFLEANTALPEARGQVTESLSFTKRRRYDTPAELTQAWLEARSNMLVREEASLSVRVLDLNIVPPVFSNIESATALHFSYDVCAMRSLVVPDRALGFLSLRYQLLVSGLTVVE